jgi:GPH family glycoside/pentoside/hexuronide:cation symporter
MSEPSPGPVFRNDPELRSSVLPLRTRLLYGTSRLGSEALGRSQALWLLYYYAPPPDAHLPTLLPSIAVVVLFTVGGILSALDDVIVGWLSDRTRSRWGRRIPYIVLGAPLWSIFYILIFVPPASAGHAATAVYFFLVFLALSLAGSIVVGPYEALLPEIAATSDERVGVQAIKVYLGVAGTGIGLIGSAFLINHLHVGYRAMAITFAAFAIVCQYVAVAGVWGRAKQSRIPAEIDLRDALSATFRNRGFRILVPTVVLFALAVALLLVNTPFYVHSVVGHHSWLSPTLMLAVAFLSALACVPVFIRLGARTSKRHAYSVSMLCAAATFPLLTVAGVIPGIPASVQILVAVALIGAPLGAHFLFPVPLTADVIDDDSTRTKKRREATFLGASSFVERTATALAPLIIFLLGLAGETRGHSLGVRLVGIVGGALILAGYFVFRRYDVPDEVRDRVPPEAVAPPDAAPPLPVEA